MDFYDRFGGLQLLPEEPYANVEQTENSPLYSGEAIIGRYKKKKLTATDCYIYVNYVSELYRDGIWFPTPVSFNTRFSHDNMTGTICGLLTVIKWVKENGFDEQIVYKHAKKLLKSIPWFHHKYLHPRDIFFIIRIKIPVIGFLITTILPVTQATMIVSCLQTYKVRNGNKIIKTDGKLLAWTRLNTVWMPITKMLCTFILSKKKDFKNFNGCARMYFRHAEHPNRENIE